MTTEQGSAALEEFGFAVVPLDTFGAPTPGRIADRLSDIAFNLEEAISAHDRKGVVLALAELRRLRLALDAWDTAVLHRGNP